MTDGRPATPAPTLAERDLAVFWHPCSQMQDYRDFPPLEIVSAEGARLCLGDGREILDAISSWWCKSLGHGHAGVRAKIAAQLNRFEHVIAAQTTHAGLVELCERLLALSNGDGVEAWGPRPPVDEVAGTSPPSVEPSRRVATERHFGKVFLCENGSTAVEIALKMALQAQAQRGQGRRRRFAALSGGYHGETVGALSVGDLGLYADPFAAMMFEVHKLEPVPHRSGADDPMWLDADEEWRRMLAQLAPLAASLAAIIYEPVLQAAGGMRLYSPALLGHLRRFADEHGIFLIADEIAAGMGRLGTMLASELGAIDSTSAPSPWPRPDLLLLGKGLTAGFLPLSAVLTTDEIYATFYSGEKPLTRAFLHSNTHTANALTIAAALGALDAYATEGVLAHVAALGPTLLERMRAIASVRPTLAHVRGLGMVAAVDLVAKDGENLEPAARSGYRVYREAVKRGALLRPLGDTLYLFPPLNCPRAELEAMLSILADSVDAVMR